MDNSAEAEKFIKELEEKRGGHIEWKTVALFYGDSNRVSKESLFVYKIGDTFYFEDSEKESTFLGIKVKQPKNYKYVKFEGSFKAIEVDCMEKVLTSDAKAYCEGKKDKVLIAGPFATLFKQTALKIEFDKNKFIVMEMLREREFVQLVEMEKNKFKWVQTREV